MCRTQNCGSPANPFLYDLKLSLINPSGQVVDQVTSYFGMRKISLGNLNGNKYLFFEQRATLSLWDTGSGLVARWLADSTV